MPLREGQKRAPPLRSPAWRNLLCVHVFPLRVARALVSAEVL